MPVDKAVLQQLIDEIPFTKADDKTYLMNSLLADESAATQFIGQRLRHSDYTKKTTDLSTREKTLADKANESVRTYATQLAEAQGKLRDIMGQLENEQVSSTKARALLAKVKTVYNLSDEDIPKIEDGGVKPGSGNEGMLSEARVRELLKEQETALLTKLAPINSFPMIPVLINEMQHEHQALTGQRLPESEIRELMKLSAQDNGPSLRGAWEEKYGIPEKRKAAERADWSKQERTKWEDEQKTIASEAALRGVTRGADGTFKSQSPVMGRKYPEHVDSTNRESVEGRDAGIKAADVSGPKPSGAERAAAKFLERRAAGIPMGQEAPAGNGR